LRLTPAAFARLIALPRSAVFSAASGIREISTSAGRSHTGLGDHAGSVEVGAALFQGQTSWQISQP